mgnify:FL=1
MYGGQGEEQESQERFLYMNPPGAFCPKPLCTIGLQLYSNKCGLCLVCGCVVVIIYT